MILNRGPIIEQNGEQALVDYLGRFYPQGIDFENVFYFNKENVDEVILKNKKMMMKFDFGSCFMIGKKMNWGWNE